jgi:hypothetical protein
MNTTTFSRRKLLSGLGAGAFLFGPMARSRLSMAAGNRGNFLQFNTPNGFKLYDNITRKSVPYFKASGSGAALTFGSALAPFEPVKGDVVVLAGMNNKCPGLTTSSHPCGLQKLTTCVWDGTDNDVGGPSIDYALARNFNQNPLCMQAGAGSSKPSWRGPGAPNVMTNSPKTAYANAFGALMPATSPQMAAATDDLLKRKKSVLDFVTNEASLFRTRLGASDRRLLDYHLTALRDLETKLAVSLAPPADPRACAADRAKAASAITGASVQATGEAMLEIAATAFGCGVVRSAVMDWGLGSWGIMPLDKATIIASGVPNVDGRLIAAKRDGAAANHHDITHNDPAGSHAAIQHLIDQWYAQRMADFLALLKGRGLLDTTIVVWTSECNDHYGYRQTVVVGGGKGLGFKTGQAVTYTDVLDNKMSFLTPAIYPSLRQTPNRSYNDLWVCVQKAMGINSPYFGDREYCIEGNLQELYEG